VDLGAEFVVGDGRRDDSGQQSRPLAQSPLLFRLSPLTAGLISPRCVAGVGDKKIFSILAKKY